MTRRGLRGVRSAQAPPVSDDLNLPVASPLHLIHLKLFAIHKDPYRRLKDLAALLPIDFLGFSPYIAGSTIRSILIILRRKR